MKIGKSPRARDGVYEATMHKSPSAKVAIYGDDLFALNTVGKKAAAAAANGAKTTFYSLIACKQRSTPMTAGSRRGKKSNWPKERVNQVLAA